MQDEYEDPLKREALEWFVRLRDQRLPEAERRAFADWLARSPEHRSAWSAAEQLWARFEPVDAQLRQRKRRSQLQRRRAVLGGGLGALFLGLGGWWAARPEHWADLRSGTGEVSSATLADGSTVELGSRTALSLDYSDRTRRLVLHEGEAFFIVAADPRPFVVAAEAGEARALGTRFNLRALDGVVTVAVAEHSVAVTVPGAAPATVDEGWQLAYGKSGIEALEPADLASIAAWRQGRLIFRNTPLRAVLSEIGRYRDGTIVLLDDRLGSIPVTAVFDIASIGSALDTIEATLPIRLTRATDFLVFVTAG